MESLRFKPPRISAKNAHVNPALETLMLAFSTDAHFPVPPRALFLGAQPHPALQAWPEITGWQPFKPQADAWEKAGFPRTDEVPAGKWPLVLVLPGKSRDETLSWFAIARDRLETGGRMVIAMPNTAGAARFEKEFAKATGKVASLQKHKCRVFHAVDDGTWNEALFDEWRALAEPRKIPGTHFITQAGVFSSEHIDPGSQFLSDHLPASLRGRVADLGAGWGFLTHEALRRCPKIERIDLFEADFRALACARNNLSETGRDLHFHWHDVAAGLPEIYDAILMNPPFHTGQATDVDLGRVFLTTAAASLKRGGQLYIVANRQLPYEAVLDSCQLRWRKPAENATYKLLFADKR
jgi:16S rRNA (guanine1207-N2)-methyltransferase